MAKWRFVILLFLATALFSCSTGKQTTNPDHKSGSSTVNAQGTFILGGEEVVLPFWSNLFINTCKGSEQENICISPLSAQMVLSMAAAGATGETQQQMYSTMNLTGDVNSAAKKIVECLSDSTEGCEASIANSIWVNEKFDVKKSFIDTNKTYFNALVTTAPFNKETLQAINEWCSENTKGKIKSALEDIKKEDQMYLINALYFKSEWKDKFINSLTEEKPFKKEDGNEIDVPMMYQQINTLYYEDEAVQVAVKPFKGGYNMLLVLPAEGVTTEEGVAYISHNYKKIMGSMSTYKLALHMPKFQSDFSASLKGTLESMGMQRAFSNKAQFDGISEEPIRVNDIFQNTHIKVEEAGAEAAAVTIMRAGSYSALMQFERRTMNLNKPFIYLITNNDNIIFIGKVGNPNE
ncbi:MAG: hypothetical protein IKY37_06555 [Bacteroidaceae bacterium]|nr:hypothetical protein [Bacteroidaceae bacterium]